jgi:hypothetical protein
MSLGPVYNLKDAIYGAIKQLKLGLRSDYGIYSFGAVLPQTIKF